MSADKTFVDTNVLIYAHDFRNIAKREIADSVIRTLWNEGSGRVSTQVLQEFYVTITRKIPKPLSKDAARTIVKAYESWCVETTIAEISAAFQFEDDYGISFWDALILASASKSGAGRILTEDLNAGQRYAGVLVENPFAGIHL